MQKNVKSTKEIKIYENKSVKYFILIKRVNKITSFEQESKGKLLKSRTRHCTQVVTNDTGRH